MFIQAPNCRTDLHNIHLNFSHTVKSSVKCVWNFCRELQWYVFFLYSYLEMGSDRAIRQHLKQITIYVILIYLNNIDTNNICFKCTINSQPKHDCLYLTYYSRHWNTQTPRGSKNPFLSLENLWFQEMVTKQPTAPWLSFMW